MVQKSPCKENDSEIKKHANRGIANRLIDWEIIIKNKVKVFMNNDA